MKGIINVCTMLGIDIIAEGVETTEEFYWLYEYIYLYQGYLFAKPELATLPKKFWTGYLSQKTFNNRAE